MCVFCALIIAFCLLDACYSRLYFQCDVCMNSDVQLCLMPARWESDTYLWHFPSPSHTHTHSDPDVHVFSSGSEVFWQGVIQLLPHTFSSRSVRVEEHTHTHTRVSATSHYGKPYVWDRRWWGGASVQCGNRGLSGLSHH